MIKSGIVKGVKVVFLLTLLACKSNDQQAKSVQTDQNMSLQSALTTSSVLDSTAYISPRLEDKVIILQAKARVSFNERNQVEISSRVAGRIERLYVRYNYQPIKKGMRLMDIYSPELLAAQQELLYLASQPHTNELLETTKERLRMLGMENSMIVNLLRKKQVLQSIPIYANVDGVVVEKNASVNALPVAEAPAASSAMADDGMGSTQSAATSATTTSSTSMFSLSEGQYVRAGEKMLSIYSLNDLWAEISIKKQWLPFMKKNMPLLMTASNNGDQRLQKAQLNIIESQLRNDEQFVIARAYLKNSPYKPGELLNVQLPIAIKNTCWLPQSAVLSLGDKNVVFVSEAGNIVPKTVQIGLLADGFIQVKGEINNWKIVKNAAYLVDSESFIKMD